MTVKPFSRNILSASIPMTALSVATPLMLGQIRDIPQRLTIEAARSRYLEIICPVNIYSKRLGDIQESLMNAPVEQYEQRRQVVDKEVVAIQAKLADLEIKASNDLADPRFIWPESVRGLAQKASAIYLEYAALSRSGYRGPLPMEYRMTFSEFRQKLGLGPRGTGCPASR